MTIKSRVNPVTAALMLAAILGASGQSSPSVDRGTQPVAKASQQQTRSTKTNAPTNQQSTRQQARLIGGGPDPRQRRNPLRQVRRLFERMGWITSGRQWRNFRKLARRDESVAKLIEVALRMSPADRSQAIRVARTGRMAA